MSDSIMKVKRIKLRPVTLADSSFILSLRVDESKNRYLSRVADDLGKQREWIVEYKKREAAETEFYYIVETPGGQSVGTIRMYDFRGDSFCWGSWVLSGSAPSYAGVESMLALYEYGFYFRGFRQGRFDVVRGNKKVIAFNLRFGATQVAEDGEKVHFNLTRQEYAHARKRYSKFFL